MTATKDEANASGFVTWPEGEPAKYNGSGEPCDMWIGPCCCGATHTAGERSAGERLQAAAARTLAPVAAVTREDLIKLARLAVAGIHRPDDCENPVSYDPPEWVLEALGAAWRAGACEANVRVIASVSPPPPRAPTRSSERRTQRMKRKR